MTLIEREKLLKLPYEQKIKHCKQMIKDFLHLCTDPITNRYIENKEPFIAFSGGKDSLCMAHMIRSIDQSIKVISSAEQYHPEIIPILKEWKADIVPSKMTFWEFCDKKGLPAFGKKIIQEIAVFRDDFKFRTPETKKRRLEYCNKRFPKYAKLSQEILHLLTKSNCCDYVKGNVKHLKAPVFVGTTIYESDIRKEVWKKNGCIDWKNKKCTPISILTDKEVWRYIKENNLHYSKAYDMGWSRTGCLCCPMGIQFKKRRQELLLVKKYYPQVYMEFYKRYEPLIKVMGYKELELKGADNGQARESIKRDIRVM